VNATLDIERLRVGDEIPSFVRTTSLENWNRFAAVNDEFVPIHMEDDAARAAGFATAIGMGNLQSAYLHAMIRDWLCGCGRLVSLSCQFRSPNTRGMTVSARGKIASIESSTSGRGAVLEIWTEDQDGSRLAIGSAKVAFTPGEHA
jgi:acyl dehydratase